jgi:hypothetical protein
VKAAKSIGPPPRIVARIVQAHNRQHTKGEHDDQVDLTPQFVDWVKTPMPSWGFPEFYRREAEALEQPANRRPSRQSGPKGSVEWLAQQNKSS